MDLLLFETSGREMEQWKAGLWDTPSYHIKSFTYFSHVQFNRDGKYLVTFNGFISDKNTIIEIINIETDSITMVLRGHSSPIASLECSPDGKNVLSTSYDKTIKLWGIETGACLKTFIGHKDTLRTAKFSKDGKTILSGSQDGEVILWDAEGDAPIDIKKSKILAKFPFSLICLNKSFIQLRISASVPLGNMEIYKLNGGKVASFTFDKLTEGVTKIKLPSTLASGLYLYTITSVGSGIKTKFTDTFLIK